MAFRFSSRGLILFCVCTSFASAFHANGHFPMRSQFGDLKSATHKLRRSTSTRSAILASIEIPSRFVFLEIVDIFFSHLNTAQKFLLYHNSLDRSFGYVMATAATSAAVVQWAAIKVGIARRSANLKHLFLEIHNDTNLELQGIRGKVSSHV